MVGKRGRSSWGNGIIWQGIALLYRLASMMPAKSPKRSNKMQTSYPLRVQAIRSRGQNPRLYVGFPSALAAAIGLEPGEEVHFGIDVVLLHLRPGHVLDLLGRLRIEERDLAVEAAGALQVHVQLVGAVRHDEEEDAPAIGRVGHELLDAGRSEE